jgi:diguanylate cyclase (GGDEF)-like protein/PAS domain S-box-containing protein
MRITNSILRIGMSLALMGLCILLTGDFLFGKYSDDKQITMQARSSICESLAIQFSSLMAVDDLATIRMSLKALVLRDDDILSAAVRSKDGKIRAEAGNHQSQWKKYTSSEKSSLTHVQVPIFKSNTRWGTVEMRFADIGEPSMLGAVFSPFVLLTIYVLVAGFAGYVFFIRRTLKHLDPSAVIPDRVKAALDVLTEGVVLVDTRQQVVLANTAISDKLGINSTELMGKYLSEMAWSTPDGEASAAKEYPWQLAMADGESRTGTRLQLSIEGNEHTFMVNSSPILNDDGKTQGALATFDDVSELEGKNVQLSILVSKLQSSRDEVNRKNEELQVLAERDSLTGCLNRRAFFDRANAEFDSISPESGEIAIIMLDIDQFKAINDDYGHGVGDEVIESLAVVLQSGLRSNEVLGRYGGEEFIVLVPDSSMALASGIADRLRQEVENVVAAVVSTLKDPVTASFGVSSSGGGAADVGALIDQADQALYVSKERGRNRVTRWDNL